ncbi:contractile injection system protein, VgrG/Pvc8 family [Anaerosinus massiliensis]|uniref:contractile injection system protein, VgrG/Pvc8 family n=1 Tax=Massilibacillus massiliensis TaxID=1806837 RepID=UPI0018FEA59E|nr:contractile injection system protein, VgrG/Pvc8 family [Massilibacillus massiliensis]
MEEKEKHPAFTHTDIQYLLPVPIISIASLEIVQNLNEHVKMKLTALAPDTLGIKDIEAVPENSKIEIQLPGRSTPYFAGVCTNIEMQVEGGLKTITLEALSWTYALDIVEYSRSYQQLGISYETLLADILKEYPETMYLVELEAGRQYDQFIVQYKETPWNLLKRIAAREGTILTPEYADGKHRPRFWLGLPQTIAEELPLNADQYIQKDNKTYLELAANQFPKVEEADFLIYQTTGYETMHLGQAVTYHEKDLIVIHIDSRLEKELLTHTFTLAPTENIVLKESGGNTRLKSCALPGTIIERSDVHVKIHLDIDEQQDKAIAKWFPYAADGDSFMYCMPHEGESINLYFRNEWEEEAIAISGARANGQSCQKTGDYNHRYFTNHERKEMYIAPDTLSFTADESAAVKIAVVMTDANGIDIVSAKDIVFSAENDLKIKGKTISIEAGAPGSQPAAGATPPGLYLNTGLASIILKEDITNIYGKPVKLEGTNKAPCPQPEEVEEDAEEGESGLTAEDWKDIGLAVVGCIPIVGSVVAVGEALSEAYDGNYVDAGISLAGVIPFAGTVGKVAKFAKKGKIAGKIAKALNVGKKLKKGFKGKKTRLPFGKMKTKGKRVQANTNKVTKDAAGKIADAKEKAKKFKFGKYLKSKIGGPPAGMKNPHAHHILFKEGLGKAQKKLVKEGQKILKKYDIDPIYGVENLVWAPNGVKGQHDIKALKNVVDKLKEADMLGGTKQHIVETLKELGNQAAKRGGT